MASSAVVAAAGERLSPFCSRSSSRGVRDCSTSDGPEKGLQDTLTAALGAASGSGAPADGSLCQRMHSLFTGHVSLLKDRMQQTSGEGNVCFSVVTISLSVIEASDLVCCTSDLNKHNRLELN